MMKVNLHRVFIYVTCFFCFLHSHFSFSQEKFENVSNGIPFLRAYSEKNYRGHPQNFAITQDHRGVMYFGNFEGILEFDGVFWNKITTKNNTRANSLLTHQDGRIYVGCLGDFGFLAPNAKGKLTYFSIPEKYADQQMNKDIKKSLISNVFDTDTIYSEIKSIISDDQRILFVSDRSIISFANQKLNILVDSDKKINKVFFANGKVFVFFENDALKYLEGNTLKPVFYNLSNQKITEIVTTFESNNKLIIVTPQQGFFQMINDTISDLTFSHEKYLINKQLSCGAKLNNNTFAIGTYKDGLYILNSALQVTNNLTETNGLISNNINAVFQTKERNLWIASNNGLSLIDFPSPLSIYNEKIGLYGEVFKITRYSNELYLATNDGLYCLKNDIFQKIAGIKYACNDILSIGKSLLIGTNGGLFLLENQLTTQLNDAFCLTLFRGKKDSSTIYVARTDGIFIYHTNALSAPTYKIGSLNYDITEIHEDSDGLIWLQTANKGFYRYNPDNKILTNYGLEKGLPTLLSNNLNEINGKIYAGTQNGVYEYDNKEDVFKRSALFTMGITTSKLLTALLGYDYLQNFISEQFWISDMVPSTDQSIWMTEGDKTNVSSFVFKNQLLSKNSVPFIPLREFKINVIFPETDKITWFGSNEGLIRYNADVINTYQSTYHSLIRTVSLSDYDSVLYYGASDNSTTIKTPVLDFKYNTIKFNYSATTFNSEQFCEFQYILEGFDKTWSNWTAYTEKEYTNLPSGNYQFKVKARNLYNQISNDTIYEFTVLKPVHLRWWAIVIYVVVFLALIYLLIKWRVQVLNKEKILLEQIVRERTEEIENQKEELRAQSDELAGKNDELEKIDQIVQSINSEIHFAKLLNSFLLKISKMTRIDRASALVLDKKNNTFRFKATLGIELSQVENVELSIEQIEQRYLYNAREIHEDIFLSQNLNPKTLNNALDLIQAPKALLAIVVKIEDKTEGFLLLSNMHNLDAFDEQDFSMARNLKEHINSAFIKAQILENLQNTLNHLRETQEELIRKEKLASVGQLTKGIVDRLINPMNYINNFSQISADLANEIREVLDEEKSINQDTRDDVEDLIQMLKKNLVKINEHGTSSSRIIKGMEKLLREKSNNFIETDVHNIIESAFNYAYQEFRSEYKDFVLQLNKSFNVMDAKIKVLPEELGLAIQNIVNNSCYATYMRSQKNPDFKPFLDITTNHVDDIFQIKIYDNGFGMPEKELIQLFQPFFTTKPTSKGTGLGLFMAQDIIKLHKGEIVASSKEGEYTEISITLPIKY